MTRISRGAVVLAFGLSFAGFAPAMADAPPLVAAPSVDAPGARALQGGLKAWLGAYLGGLGPEISVAFDGALTVVPEDGRYHLTVPGWRAVFADGAAMVAGATVIELTPAGGDTFETAWALPSELRLQDDGGPAVTVSIGHSEGRGLFDGKLHLFRDLHLSLGDVRAAPATTDPAVLEAHLSLQEVFFDLTATPGADALWDVAGAAGLRGIDYAEKTTSGESSLQLGAVAFHVSSAGLDLPALLTFLSGASRLDGAGGLLSATPSPDVLASLAALMANTPKLFDGLHLGWSVSAFATTDSGPDTAAPPARTALEAASFSIAIDGFREDAADTTIQGHLGGLAVADPEAFADFVPRLIDLDMTLEDVPGSVMASSLRDLVQGGVLGAPDAAFSFAIAQIFGAFESGSALIRLDRLLVDFGPWALDLSGRLRPAPPSPIGAAGDLSLVIGGMQAMIAQLGALWSDSDPFLNQLLALGHPTTDSAGRPGRQYDVVIDPATGSMTLNGTDIDDLESP